MESKAWIREHHTLKAIVMKTIAALIFTVFAIFMVHEFWAWLFMESKAWICAHNALKAIVLKTALFPIVFAKVMFHSWVHTKFSPRNDET